MNEDIFDTLDLTMLARTEIIYENEGEDLKQQAFLNAWERRKDISPQTINKYIKDSIKSSFIKVKKNIRQKNKALKDFKGLSYYPAAEYQIELKEFTIKANRIISKLDISLRKTLEYRLLNYSIQEIAIKTKTKNGTVMSRLHSIRKTLKDELSEYSDLLI